MGERRAWLLAMVLMGCGRSDPPSERAVHAGDLARFPAFAGAVAASEPLVAGPTGLRIRAPSGLEVVLPTTADGPTRVAVTATHFLELVPLDVGRIAAQLEAHGVRYANVAPATDAFHLVERRRVEEVRVLRTESAPRILRWRIVRGPDIATLRVRARWIEALDREGRARLRMEPPFVVDAAGVRKELVPQLADDVLELSVDATGLAYPLAVDPAWGSTDALAIPHAGHDAARLANGKVLIAGGEISPGVVTSQCELYDPATRTFTLAAPMKSARVGHKLRALSADKWLAIGGTSDTTNANILSTTEIYDGAADTWTVPKPMPVGRAHFGAVSLASPTRVVVLGGMQASGTALSTATSYDAATDTWTDGANAMSAGRFEALVARVGASRILVAGGNDGGDKKADVFDPATNMFFPAAPMLADHIRGQCATMSDGRVLVVGGAGFGGAAYGPITTAEIYDRATDSWTAAGAPGARIEGRAVLLSDGRIYAASGGALYASPSATVATSFFDPTTSTWSAGPNVVRGRNRATLTPLVDGSILMAGGDLGAWFGGGGIPKNITATVELFGNELAAGATCATNGACASALCVDGRCCDRACTGSCESCAVAGKEGTCSLVTGTPVAGHVACTGTGPCAGTCDGLAATCTFPTTECVAGACTNGTASAQAFCDGAGKCATKTATTCAPYACGAVSCKTTCALDADCISGRVCERATGACVLPKPRGATCTAATECSTGACADGLCCDRACDGACEACNVAASEGVCVALDPAQCPADAGSDVAVESGAEISVESGIVVESGVDASTNEALPIAESGTPLPATPAIAGAVQHCAKDAECATGHCVEGVCCDSECRDRCHSCALLASPGRCTAEPIGVDLKSECGPARSCLGTCDGSGQCIGAGTGSMCARNRCLGPSNGVGPAYCAAPGAACTDDAVVAFECAPYACDGAFGACATQCSKSDDCARDFVCDVGSKTCIAPPPPESDGCAMTHGPVRGSFALMSLAMLLAIRGRRRR